MVSSGILGAYPSTSSLLITCHWLQSHWHDPGAGVSWLTCSQHLVKVWGFSTGLNCKFTWVKILTRHLPSLLGSHSTRQTCHPKNPSWCSHLARSWYHPSGSAEWLVMERSFGEIKPKRQLCFQRGGKKWKCCPRIHFVVCRPIVLMAFSLKVLAVKCCFLSLSEYSALIISSSFWKLFMESIALVSLHARQDRKKALYRCMHRADLFNILLRTTRYSTDKENPENSLLLPKLHAVLTAKWVMLAAPKCGKVNLLPRPSAACLARGKRSPSSPHPANGFILQRCWSGLFLWAHTCTCSN